MTIQRSVQAGLLRPLRKMGLALASQWPWPVAATLKGGRRMFVDLRSPVGRAIYMKGEFDPRVFDALAGRLAAGGLMLDVGANVGYYGLRALDILGPSGAVHAFEIDPRPLRCLRKTVKNFGLENLFIHDQAVGDRDGKAFLVQKEDCGHSSVNVEGDGSSVPMITLDAWRAKHPGGKIQVIKLDVEGGELRVLRGAVELLRRERPLLVCEVIEDSSDGRSDDAQALFSLLGGLGYKHRWIEGCNDATIAAE